MYILNNAIKSLFRNKLRNFFYIVTLLLMISSIAIFEIINSSTKVIISNYKEKFESYVQIRIDQDKFMKSTLSGLSIKDYQPSTEDYFNFANSEYVKEAYFAGSMITYVDKNTKQKIDTKKDSAYDTIGRLNCIVFGYSNNIKSNLFSKNIKEGKIFQNNNECIVSQRFIENNNLKLGDEINLSSPYKNQSDKTLNLKIVGVYENKNISNENIGIITPDMETYEDILTNYDTLVNFEKELNSDESVMSTYAQFSLKDSKSREKFENELRIKGLNKMYKVSIDEGIYKKVVSPVGDLAKTSLVIMYAVLIFGSSLLIIISILSIKNMKYEIGVFRAIGITKFNVAKGFLYEGIIMTIICLVLGITIAIVSAQPVSNYVFKYKQEIVKTSRVSVKDEISYSDIGSEISNWNLKKEVNDIKNIKIIITKDSIFKVIVISILLGLLTSIVAIYNSIIYKPIQIFSDRN